MTKYCPKCWSEITPAQECYCDACGYFCDQRELLNAPGNGFNLTKEVIILLALFHDTCRSEMLMEQLCEAGVVTEQKLAHVKRLRQGAIHSLIELFVKLKTRPSIPSQVLTKHPHSGMIPWPADWPDRHYNGREPCDMLVGPCSCGAFHREDEQWIQEKLIQHQAVIV